MSFLDELLGPLTVDEELVKSRRKEYDEAEAKIPNLERRFTETFGYKPRFFGSVIEYEERLRESLETGKPKIGKVPEDAVL